uniref:uncharacterized protein LOC118533204 isoform X3 n=1 Tax=Halichoerus grypus TaxID=9711 RepID=UPI001659742F|nr:uncharacterized protein LOC118533204 isoform X3 [Halichoerus grypus]
MLYQLSPPGTPSSALVSYHYTVPPSWIEGKRLGMNCILSNLRGEKWSCHYNMVVENVTDRCDVIQYVTLEPACGGLNSDSATYCVTLGFQFSVADSYLRCPPEADFGKDHQTAGMMRKPRHGAVKYLVQGSHGGSLGLISRYAHGWTAWVTDSLKYESRPDHSGGQGGAECLLLCIYQHTTGQIALG